MSNEKMEEQHTEGVTLEFKDLEDLVALATKGFQVQLVNPDVTDVMVLMDKLVNLDHLGHLHKLHPTCCHHPVHSANAKHQRAHQAIQVTLALMDHQEIMDNLVKTANPVIKGHVGHPDNLEIKDNPVAQDLMVNQAFCDHEMHPQAVQENQAVQDCLDNPAVLEKEAKMETMDHPANQDHQVDQAALETMEDQALQEKVAIQDHQDHATIVLQLVWLQDIRIEDLIIDNILPSLVVLFSITQMSFKRLMFVSNQSNLF